MSDKNYSSQNHAFDVQNAVLYGVDIALLIHHFQFWISYNARLGKNYIEAKTWMYQTQKQLSACLPYYSEKQICRIIEKMLEKRIIVKGNHNKSAYDRTQWYSFADEKMFSIPRNRGMEEPKTGNGIPEIVAPIPYTEKDAEKKQQPVVVFSHLKKLDLTLSLQEKLSSEYTEQQVTTAVEKCLKWKGRNSDAAAIVTILKEGDKWQAPKTSEDKTTENSKFLWGLQKYDGRTVGNSYITVGNTYIEFVAGMSLQRFEITLSDFIDKVKAHFSFIKQYA